jgi:hypothetical protein
MNECKASSSGENWIPTAMYSPEILPDVNFGDQTRLKDGNNEPKFP